MFCTYCGKNVGSDDSFCPGCGKKLVRPAFTTAPVTAPAPARPLTPALTVLPPVSEPAAPEEPFRRVWLLPDTGLNAAYDRPFTENPASRSVAASIALLRSAKAYKDSQFPYAEKVDRLEKEEEQIKSWLSDKGGLTAFGAVGLFLGFLLFLKWAVRAYAGGGFLGSMPIVGTFLLLIALALLACSAAALVSFIRKFTRRSSKQQRLLEIEREIRQVYAEFQGRIDDENSPVRVNAMNYGWLFPTLNVSVYQISHMINALQTGRAGTFREALLNYDRCMHEDKMENIAVQTAEFARRSAQAAERTAEAAEAAAAAAASVNATAVRMWAGM